MKKSIKRITQNLSRSLKKGAYDIQTPEVQARMKQNQKDSLDAVIKQKRKM